jgi:hypothetical protein
MSNIIDFKSVKDTAKAKAAQDLLDQEEEESIGVEDFADDFALTAVMDIVEALGDFGFDVMEKPDVLRDMLLTAEGIRGIIHRVAGTNMDVHAISDTMFGEITDTKEQLIQFLNDFSE